MYQDVAAKVGDFLALQPLDSKLIVAFSGGLDSTVLLHILVSLYPLKLNKLHAVHVDHGLQQQSATWAQHCRQVCQQLGVSLSVESLQLGTDKGNIEARARDARYAVLHKYLTRHHCLLTGHHQDDQAETLLLNLMRGSGVDGLAAMQPVTMLTKGRMLRPLLDVSRQQLLEYAQHFSLEWIDDPSNLDERFDRNFVRSRLLPLMASRWPHATKAVATSAAHCRNIREYVEKQIDADLRKLAGRQGHSLDIKAFNQLEPFHRQLVLRQWLRQNHIQLPDSRQQKSIIESLQTAPGQSLCLDQWQDIRLYVHDEYLYLIRDFVFDAHSVSYAHDKALQKVIIDLPAPAGVLHLTLHQPFAGDDAATFEIRFRQPGEKFYLQNRDGARKLKKLQQQWRVPVWMRDLLPLIYYNGNCIAIGDFAWCQAGQSPLSEVFWLPEAPLEWRQQHLSLRSAPNA